MLTRLAVLCVLALACKPATSQVLGAVRNSFGSTSGLFDFAGSSQANVESSTEAAVPPASNDPETGSRGVYATAEVVAQEATRKSPPPGTPSVPYLSGMTGHWPDAAALGKFAGLLDLNEKLPSSASTSPYVQSFMPPANGQSQPKRPRTSDQTSTTQKLAQAPNDRSAAHSPPETTDMKKGTPITVPKSQDKSDARSAASNGFNISAFGGLAYLTAVAAGIVILT